MENMSDVLAEWGDVAAKKPLGRRELSSKGMIRTAKKRIVSLTGIRRSGKSSFLMLLYRELLSAKEKAVYTNLEDDRLQFPGVLDEILKHVPDAEWLLLDEITSIKKWENWLHRMSEMKNVRLIVSSSLNKLSRFPPRPLRGRVTYFELFPLSFSEFLRFKGIEVTPTMHGRGRIERALEKFLVYGGFPEVVLSDNNKIEIIQEYFNSIVSLDISSLTTLPFGTVSAFAHQLFATSIFSASKMERTMKSAGYKIAKTTLLDLEKLFEMAYLVFFVPIFSPKVKDERHYPRKVYLGDTGFVYAIRGKKDFGRLYENAVFLQLRRELGPIESISYYKSKEGYEVDFVVKKGTKAKRLIQVAYNMQDEKTKKREIRSLVSAAKEFGIDGRDEELMLLTKDYEKKEKAEGKTIVCKKLWKWLLGR